MGWILETWRNLERGQTDMAKRIWVAICFDSWEPFPKKVALSRHAHGHMCVIYIYIHTHTHIYIYTYMHSTHIYTYKRQRPTRLFM